MNKCETDSSKLGHVIYNLPIPDFVFPETFFFEYFKNVCLHDKDLANPNSHLHLFFRFDKPWKQKYLQK